MSDGQGGQQQLVRENEALRRQVAALQTEAERFKATLYSIGDAVICTDADGNVLQMNPVAEALTGWSEVEAKGRPTAEVFKIVNEETRAEVESPVARVLREGTVVGLANHTLLIAKDGTERPIADSGAPIRDEKGNVTGVVLVFRDQTEERRHEAALRESAGANLLQAELLRNAPVIAAFHDRDYNIVWANRAYEEATGLSQNEIVGRKCYAVWRLAKPCRGCPVATAIDSGVASEAELTPQNQDHWPESQGYWLSRAAPVRDENGKVIGAIEMAFDIGDRKQAEEALAESEKKYRTIFETMSEGIVYEDHDGKIISANPAAERLLGLSLEQLQGRTSVDPRWKAIHEDGSPFPGENHSLNVAAKNGKPATGEIMGIYNPQSDIYVWLSVNSTPEFLPGETTPVGAYAVFRDITERKRAEEALRDSEERNLATLQSIGDGVISTDASGRVTQMNPTAQALTGWGEAEALGQPLARVFRIVNEETRAAVESPVDRVLREGKIVGLANHTVLIAKDGAERPIADSGAPIRNTAGDVTGVVLVFRDQSEERRAEKEVAAAEERFRTFFDNAPIGKCMTAPDGKLVRVNAAFGAMLGYSIEEMQTISFVSITHPEDLAESRECVRALLAGEQDTWVMEKRYLAKDGHHVWTQVTTRLQRDEKQRPLHFLTHILDITDSKRAETRLRDETNRIRTILDLVGDPIFVKDNDHRITLANRAFCEVFGLDEHDVLGRTLVEAVLEDERQHFLAVDRTVLDTGVPDLREEELTTKDLTRTIITRKVRFIDESGQRFLVGSIHDITERKAAEEKIRTLNKELDQRVVARTVELTAANKELEAFAYSVSHDLRAPLRGIDGFSKALLDDYQDKLDATATDYINRVRAGTQRMGMLIDDLLKLSRMTRAEMHHQHLDLGELGRKIALELQHDDPDRRVDFEVSHGLTARGDRALLQAALENLLRNAWKFTGHREHARIELGVTENAGERVYYVRDDGAGFDMAYVDKLFGPFQRLHNTTEFPGSGIGLAIVQRVILRHGGRIWAEGKVDKGATFYFTLSNTSENAGEGAES